MRTVMPRFLRPRLLLLPLVLGVLVVPAFLTGSAPGDSVMHVGAVCSNVGAPAKSIVKPRTAPNCVNCRAPLLNAPLARADHEAPATRLAALPPAA